MSSHRHTTRRRLPSVRVRALLSLGIAVGIGSVGTFASWTDDVTVAGTTFTAGTLDLQVNNVDSYATTTLSMSAMVPGTTSAEVLTVKNNGTVPSKYTLTGGLTGTNATDYNAAAANGLLLTVRLGGAKSGATCTGGTALVTDQPLTSTTTTTILAKRPSTALTASGGNEVLCFQVKLSDTAPSSLQGKAATATFTATGTSDIS
ncbi:TasA family protein [Aeromicrobium sp. Root344]|uniref:TasA family protein n=1 Tax=Aeromicrobium sp. Root344 TaxID=1736521 RepID=UPI0009E805D5|nr:TasA family protein [Aeromicrobium sp. Root344]